MSALKTKIEALEKVLASKKTLTTKKDFRIGVFAATPAKSLIGVVDINGKPLQGSHFDTSITEKFLPLLDPKYRFVSMRGGRGSGKSMTVAKILLLQAHNKPLKVLCFRETQNSIKDSVYQSLLDLIEELGLGQFYTFTLNEIRGANGSVFIFKGLSDQTVETVKSFSGIDIAWGEEAAFLKEKSLKILIPTIREESSRFYFTWNPNIDTDAVYQRYVLDRREDVCDVEVNYLHNPWFPQVLEVERKSDQGRLTQDDYANIWEGKLLPARVGAVYFREISKAFEDERITRVKVDPRLAIHTIWDLGWGDQTAIILAQRSLSEVRIVGYMEGNHMMYSEWNAELQEWGRKNNVSNWGTCYLPHDGRHGNMQTGQSPEEVMKAMGWKVVITENMALDMGIRAAKQMFQNVYFDKDSTGQLLECLRQYHYKELSSGGVGQPVHDQYSHGADAFRYLAVNLEKLTNTNVSNTWGSKLNYKKNSIF